ncbi:hypothetical protein DI270_015945 [Microbispora triticiradicis]|uniref:DUF892 family protein n=1 Tax=Microbispora triticiradicis TaxID=2200763 RepID=A0ABX9LJI2_9ACTN|nr:hypothetical protein [Microbispora triticiradicis]RGA04024.1 hypothetical protein DI270_015945 [Microbispora triticiradicis]GLW20187.1 hypothetical protein Mame01_02300 [Microbispora amethystogenes]
MTVHLADYLELLLRTEHELSGGFHALWRGHPREPDLCGVCERLAAQCRAHAERLEPFQRRYRGPQQMEHRMEPWAPDPAILDATRTELQRAGPEGVGLVTAVRLRLTPARAAGGKGGNGGDGGLVLLRELHRLYLLATECELSWSVVALVARGLKDDDLLDLAGRCTPETAVQLLWLRTRMRRAAPQALVVASW